MNSQVRGAQPAVSFATFTAGGEQQPQRTNPGRQRPTLGAVGLAALACLATSSHAADAPAVVDVRPGDTFSAIAARYTGNVKLWRQLYNPQLSGLANPDRLPAGARLELATDTSGARYLRVLSAPGARASGASTSTAATTSAPVAAAKPVAPRAPAVPGAAAQAPNAANTSPTAVAAAVIAAAASAGVGVGGAVAGRDDTLVIGVLPNIAPAALLEQYENVKRYLERLNPQKVRIVLPSNFKAFFDSTMRGDYDLAVAAPHFARVAQLDRNLVPLVMYEPRINALLVTPADSVVQTARDLRDKPVAFANPQSLVAMYGQQWLGQQKLDAGKDYEVKSARTDMGVGRLMLSGEAVAAVMSNGEFRALPADEAARLKIVESFARIPNFILLAHPRLDRERQARLKGQLKAFISGASEEGTAFAKATGITNIVDADDATLRELDPYAAPTRRAMGY
jgi:phosphonate transport system substrate-binding protein